MCASMYALAMKSYFGSALCATVAATLTVLTVAVGPASATPTVDASSVGTRIEIPMQAVPKPGRVSPDTRIPGNCGVAFLYASKVSRGEAHIDYGFDGLKHPSIFVHAHAGMVNLDGEGTAHDSYASPQAYRSRWERQRNLHPNHAGEYQVTAHIVSAGVLFDCVSSPKLITYVYLY